MIAGLGADEDFMVDDDVKSALGLLAENMLEDTMEFGALMASRRNSKWLQVWLFTHENLRHNSPTGCQY